MVILIYKAFFGRKFILPITRQEARFKYIFCYYKLKFYCRICSDHCARLCVPDFIMALLYGIYEYIIKSSHWGEMKLKTRSLVVAMHFEDFGRIQGLGWGDFEKEKFGLVNAKINNFVQDRMNMNIQHINNTSRRSKR